MSLEGEDWLEAGRAAEFQALPVEGGAQGGADERLGAQVGKANLRMKRQGVVMGDSNFELLSSQPGPLDAGVTGTQGREFEVDLGPGGDCRVQLVTVGPQV